MFTCNHSDSSILSCAVSSDDQMIASTSADTTTKVLLISCFLFSIFLHIFILYINILICNGFFYLTKSMVAR